MNAIEVKNLYKTYPGFTLDHISFSLPAGSILGLVGENGAGKSTTISLLMNAISRQGGSIQILGTDNQSPDFITTKQDIGIVLDEAYYPEVMTAANVDKIMQRTYTRWSSSGFYHYLTQFNLPAKQTFQTFSRGMKMKLAIAVALSHAPKLLILDEGTSGLDPMVRDEILDLFNDFTRDPGHSILLSSHIVSDLEKICDYIAFLHQGKLLFCEEKDRLLEEYKLIKVSKSNFDAIDPAAIIGKKETAYGIEALVKKQFVNESFSAEHLSLEELILFLAKGGKQQ